MSQAPKRPINILSSNVLRRQARNLVAHSKLLRQFSAGLRDENAAVAERANQLANRIGELDEKLLASYRER